MDNLKYIFFDIDGTLLDSDGVVSESTKDTLNKLKMNGHKVFVNTGRAIKLIPKVLKDLNFDGYVAGTGSYVEYHNQVIFEKYFDIDQTNRVIKLLSNIKSAFLVSASDACVARKSDIPFFIEQFTKGKIKAKDVKDLSVIDSPFFDSIKPISIDDDIDNYYYNHPKISDIVFINSKVSTEKLNKIIGDDIRFEKASFKDPDSSSGEITLADYSKATGIQCILNYFNANLSDSISVGDGFNDLDMLKFTNKSISMGNAPDEIKKASDYVTDDIYHDGIQKAFKKLNLI